jgi:hypothetical protein
MNTYSLRRWASHKFNWRPIFYWSSTSEGGRAPYFRAVEMLWLNSLWQLILWRLTKRRSNTSEVLDILPRKWYNISIRRKKVVYPPPGQV